MSRASQRLFRTISALCCGAIAVVCVGSGTALAVATVAQPVISLYTPDPQIGSLYSSGVLVRGQGFGTPSSNAYIEVKRNVSGAYWRRVDSSAALIWRDDLIVVVADRQVAGGDIKVHTAAGWSAVTPITQAYEFTSTPVLSDNGAQRFPLALTVGIGQQVWINSEFHNEFFQMLTPSTPSSINPLNIPHPAGCGPFALASQTCSLDGSHSTNTSARGEDVLVDPSWKVWFTQGGGVGWAGGTSAGPTDHSRVLRFDPFTIQWRVYSVPGNRNGVNGIAFDQTRGRMWFTSDAHDGTPAKLTSFNPDSVAYNADDFSSSQVCGAGQPDAACYHEYSLGTQSLVVPHVAVDAGGYVWFTGFWKSTGTNEIGRLNPTTGVVDHFPLSSSIQCPCPEAPLYAGDPNLYCCNDEALYVGSGPWSLQVAPDGDIVFNEFYDNTLSRFDVAQLTSPTACRSLIGGQNPCVTEIVAPETRMRALHEIHSASFDADGNYWFSHSQRDPNTSPDLIPEVPVLMGYVKPSWTEVVTLPPLSTVTFEAKGSIAGISVDPLTDDVWLAMSTRHAIGRLRRTL